MSSVNTRVVEKSQLFFISGIAKVLIFRQYVSWVRTHSILGEVLMGLPVLDIVALCRKFSHAGLELELDRNLEGIHDLATAQLYLDDLARIAGWAVVHGYTVEGAGFMAFLPTALDRLNTRFKGLRPYAHYLTIRTSVFRVSAA